ncbi:MAG: GyrI-like domain-containing protein [Lentisphaerae bacterium]|nr:GyrI-like domain-containing protein [Lentisphaerota bacterium]
MTRKAEGLGDYVVCKLEALLYGPHGEADLCAVPEPEWCWTLMIRTPACVGQADRDKAADALLEKGKCEEVKDVKLKALTEGRCVQMMHVGPYDKIGNTIALLEAFAEEQGLSFNGKHHEVFLSDPRRVEPERIKTIVRQPVA